MAGSWRRSWRGYGRAAASSPSWGKGPTGETEEACESKQIRLHSARSLPLGQHNRRGSDMPWERPVNLAENYPTEFGHVIQKHRHEHTYTYLIQPTLWHTYW